MAIIKKEFIADHYLQQDIVVEIDPPSAEVIITAYTKNTGRRRFERVKLNSLQAQGLKKMLNEFY